MKNLLAGFALIIFSVNVSTASTFQCEKITDVLSEQSESTRFTANFVVMRSLSHFHIELSVKERNGNFSSSYG